MSFFSFFLLHTLFFTHQLRGVFFLPLLSFFADSDTGLSVILELQVTGNCTAGRSFILHCLKSMSCLILDVQ
jgi:hypothetical protein